MAFDDLIRLNIIIIIIIITTNNNNKNYFQGSNGISHWMSLYHNTVLYKSLYTDVHVQKTIKTHTLYADYI